ncbi:MAG: HNH endonuclease [Sphingomonas sp.]|nr:HNH endonuclease [Sphingomonas sp.]
MLYSLPFPVAPRFPIADNHSARQNGRSEWWSMYTREKNSRMRLDVHELYKSKVIRFPSPGQCIYCGDKEAKLNNEHVIPYALAADMIIMDKSCCNTCQNIIQRYEQEVLRKQLGIFRAQVDAPSRTKKKDRMTHVDVQFVEVDDVGQFMRDLCIRRIPIDELPLAVHLWQSPMPRRLRSPLSLQLEQGKPWSFADREGLNALCSKVREETGANHVAYKSGQVSRLHYLRSLAKTAHAFAASQYGLDSFEPYLLDLILCRSDDVAEFVGDDPFEAPCEDTDNHTLQIFLGEAMGGEEQGLITARLQLYPTLGSPAHLVVVGKARIDIQMRLAGEI